MSLHYMVVCGECGKVITQCRCAACDKDKRVDTCEDCKAKAAKALASEGAGI